MSDKSDFNAKDAALTAIRENFTAKDTKIDQIIFFGSRARGDYNKNSDWDFLIVSDKTIAVKEKRRLIVVIKRKLAKLGIPNDIIIQSRSRFNSLKDFPGNISYVANVEGVPV